MAIKGIFLPRTKMPANGPWDKSWGSRSIIQFDIYMQFCLDCIWWYFYICDYNVNLWVKCTFEYFFVWKVRVSDFDGIPPYLNFPFMLREFTTGRKVFLSCLYPNKEWPFWFIRARNYEDSCPSRFSNL